MKFPKIEIHYQILLGLLLGAIFGLVFPINQNKIVFTHIENNKKVKSSISDIQNIQITYYNELTNDTISKEFGKNSQKLIIQFYNKISNIPDIKNINFKIIQISGKQLFFHSIQKIETQTTIATSLKPLGTIFINLLSMLAIPLVLTTLIVGASSLGDTKAFGKLGLTTLVLYISTTFIALTIGVLLADIIQPGKMISPEMKEFFSAMSSDMVVQVPEKTGINIVDFIVSFVLRMYSKQLRLEVCYKLCFFQFFLV
jgi:Na+/H+-dicarboxylate symporters